jgi:hypothetical protein
MSLACESQIRHVVPDLKAPSRRDLEWLCRALSSTYLQGNMASDIVPGLGLGRDGGVGSH